MRPLPYLFLQKVGDVLQGALRKVLDVSVCELLQYVYILLVKILVVVPGPKQLKFQNGEQTTIGPLLPFHIVQLTFLYKCPDLTTSRIVAMRDQHAWKAVLFFHAHAASASTACLRAQACHAKESVKQVAMCIF